MLDALPPWLTTPVTLRLLRILVGLIVVYAAVWVVTRRLTPQIKDTDARYRTRKFVVFLGYLVAAAFVASSLSDRLGGLTVAFGVAGAGVAFALQEVIASVAGWVAILVGNFFRVGDRVRLGGIRGDVIDIGVLRTTLMECGDWVDGDLYNGRIVRVANSFVFKEPVFNYSGDFPFLWDEIVLPIRHGSDRALARELIQKSVEEVTGSYAQTARGAWEEMVRKYRIEAAQVTPLVTLAATDNWLAFTARYVVDYRSRRFTKDRLFERTLAAIDDTAGRVQLASATVELVGIPPVVVRSGPSDATE